MQQWEYDIVETRHVHHNYLAPILNQRGEEGWELVSGYFQPNLTTFIFKRPAEAAAKADTGEAAA